MDSTIELENMLEVSNLVPALKTNFDKFYAHMPHNRAKIDILRKVQAYIHDRKKEYRPILQGSRLDSTDCLTLAVIASSLTSRQGLNTQIACPKGMGFLHAVLIYDNEGSKKVFKLTGMPRNYSADDCVVLTNQQIERRLRYFRPVVNLVNSIALCKQAKEHYFCNIERAEIKA